MIKRMVITIACAMMVACGGGDKKSAPVYHTITAVPVKGGHLVIEDSQAQHGYWGYSFPIVPDEHYQVAAVKGCGGRINGGYYETGTILLDCAITATFTPILYKASVNNGPGGKLVPASAEATFGTSLKFAIAAEDGFSLVAINGCGGKVVGANYVIPAMTGDCTITVLSRENAPSNTTTLQGTVAEGAALVNVAVTAKCSDGSGFLDEVITDAEGRFSGQVDNQALPCALSADSRYYSLATAEGTNNITPLTSMVLALASGEPGAQWFASEDWAAVRATLAATESVLNAQLSLSGYAMPAGDFDPFTTEFVVGDDWDELLDQLGQAIAADDGVADFEALIQLLAKGLIDQLPLPN